MALDSPEAYERLGAHLKEIDPIYQAFLAESGYEALPKALGRYPHRCASSYSDVSRTIHLQMELDENGDHFSEFDPSLPYSLWCGAWVDHEDRRYTPNRGHIIFENLPYNQMAPKLAGYLRDAAEALRPYTRAEILAKGKATKLG